MDATSSMSRIGGRAYPPALRDLAQTTRLDLVQALDAARFYSDKADPAFVKAQQRAERLTAALAQLPGRPVPLEEQVRLQQGHGSAGSIACSWRRSPAF